MITCYLVYELDPDKIPDFENYAQAWMPLVEKFGGIHHGYFVAHESANDLGVALFSFSSLGDYERYRLESAADPSCQRAYDIAETTHCIRRYDRQFLRPIARSRDGLSLT